MIRSGRPELFCENGALRNYVKFTGKHQCESLFLNKVTGLWPATLLKKETLAQVFSVNFTKFLRTPFLTEQHRWLLLTYPYSLFILLDTDLFFSYSFFKILPTCQGTGYKLLFLLLFYYYQCCCHCQGCYCSRSHFMVSCSGNYRKLQSKCISTNQRPSQIPAASLKHKLQSYSVEPLMNLKKETRLCFIELRQT